MNVKVKKLHKDAVIPKYQTPGSAGFDVHAVIDEISASHWKENSNGEKELSRGTAIEPKSQKIIGTGLAFSLPQGTELQIRPRSGLAAKNGITITNSPGTLDSDYLMELKIILCNLSDAPFFVEHGTRIAQCVVAPVIQADLEEVDEFDEETKRKDRGGGFGSTGIK